MSQEEAVVVPLVAVESEPSTEAMLRMLLNREAVVVSRSDAAQEARPSGLLAQSTGAFAKAVGQAASQIGAGSRATDLYRVILPTGAAARDLVPAVGGGFRGMVRAAGSGGIGGHVRLVPAGAGIGATIAAGPLIATVGLAVAGEMLAQHQMNKKLKAIESAVLEVRRHQEDQDHSVLVTAEQHLGKVTSYLLDGAELPAFSTAGNAFAALEELANRRIKTLDHWLDVAARYENAERVHAGQLMGDLIGDRGDAVEAFERSVAQTYEALALRARAVVLEKVASEIQNPKRSLPHVERILHAELSELGERQAQLARVVDNLSAMQIDGSKIPVSLAGRKSIGVRTSFGRLARALHDAPDAMPMLTVSDQTVLELAPNEDGLSIVSPSLA